MRITPAHEAHYDEHGYVVIENFLDAGEIASALADFDRVAPGWVDYLHDLSRPEPAPDPRINARRGRGVFPYPGNHLNDITLHAELRRFAQRNAGGADMFCEQSHLSYKCRGSPGDAEQTMHLDYGNHTLAYPPADPAYWQTAYLIYFSDVTVDTAPTAVCSRQHYPEKILWPANYTREARPALYDNEIKVVAPAGSVLAYSMRTFHRGTSFRARGCRLGMFVSYAPTAWKWMGITGWSNEAIRPEFKPWIERASVAERNALGFPPPGHAYWTEETLAGVSARYPGIDMTPYRTAATAK